MAKIVRLKELERELSRKRDIVLVGGAFDLIHVGHVRFLKECSTLGKVMVVAVASDASIKKRKGPDRPILGQKLRAEMISNLSFVDFVLITDHTYSTRNLRTIKPKKLVFSIEKGRMDRRKKDKAQIEEKCPSVKVVFLKHRSKEVSTTKIIGRIKGRKGRCITKKQAKERLLELEQRATCFFRNVGAVIVRNGLMVSEGWNTSLSGKKCTEEGCLRKKLFDQDMLEKGQRMEVTRAIHAEQLAICHAAKEGTGTDGAEMYTSIMPCIICARMIVKAGIKRVYYKKTYSNLDGLRELTENGVQAIKIGSGPARNRTGNLLYMNAAFQDVVPNSPGRLR
jgi:dCMP deaminase